ncbi:MAG: LCP family protein [Eggerthellaceae bacterium]|nr:LCP family protein [Eggerthellaceae bacterium]
MLIGAVVVLCAILAVGVLGFAKLMDISSKMNEGVDAETEELLNGMVDPLKTSDPFYMLLMGVDGSFKRGAGEMNDNEGTRSDSLMLVRIDPDNKQVTMVSIHRDMMVQIPGYGTQKINAAHAIGGPALAIKTVSDFAGVPISHYAEINFDAFEAMVDALGGVTVTVPMEINDYRAGGYVPAGEQTLNGEQALILCRSRHAYDAYGDGDTFRAVNQRMVIGAIIDKILSSDIATMVKTIEALSDYVVTDLDLKEIMGLAAAMIGMDIEEDLWSAMTPTTSLFTNNLWYEQIIQPDWDIMMERVDAGEPPVTETVVHETGTVIANAGSGGSGQTMGEGDTSEPVMHSGHVAVRNGTSVAGAATEFAAIIEKMGFTADTGDANNTGYNTTVVVYNDKANRAAALDISEELGIGLVLQNDGAYVFEGDFLVLIGWDSQS